MLDEKKIKKLSTLSAETYVEPQKMEKFCTILIEEDEEMKLNGMRLWRVADCDFSEIFVIVIFFWIFQFSQSLTLVETS